MRNVNDLGYGHCPGCKEWTELTRYHPKDKKLLRKDKKKYCNRCITQVDQDRDPFYRIKKAITNHRKLAQEGDYDFRAVMRLLAMQGGKCAYCKTGISYEFSIEHIIPRKWGGKNLLVNIFLVCLSCNSAKQHFEPVYWIQKRKLKLNERLLQKLKGAYDYHDYECTATCKDCAGSEKQQRTLCAGCPVPAASTAKAS